MHFLFGINKSVPQDFCPIWLFSSQKHHILEKMWCFCNEKVTFHLKWAFPKTSTAYIVVECKNRNVPLTQETFEHGVSYCDELGADYLVITNVVEYFIYKYNEKFDTYDEIQDIPYYKQALLEDWIPQYQEQTKANV